MAVLKPMQEGSTREWFNLDGLIRFLAEEPIDESKLTFFGLHVADMTEEELRVSLAAILKSTPNINLHYSLGPQ